MSPRAANRAAVAMALALTGLPIGPPARADEAPPPPHPDRREVWVPEKALAKALQLSPRAVLLNRAQYETLLRDARPSADGGKVGPPVPAVLRSVSITGSLANVAESDGHAALPLRAEVRVDVLGDGWTVVPLPMPSPQIAGIECDGKLAASADPQSNQLHLVVRDRGPHTFVIAFSASLEDSAGQRSLTLPVAATAETRLELDVPRDIRLATDSPVSRQALAGQPLDRIVATPVDGAGALSLAWSARDLDPLAPGAIFQNATFVYSVDAAHLQAGLALTLTSSLRDVPSTFSLPVPAGAQVLAVEGAELTRWALEGEKLTLVYPEARRRETSARITIDVPLTEAQAAGLAAVTLPTPKADAAARLTGTMTVLLSPELRARSLAAGPLTTRDDTAAPPGLAGPQFFGTWTFPILPTPPQLTVERLQPRLMANLDAQVKVGLDGIDLQRTITLTPRDGAGFSPSLTGLDPAEQIERVVLPDGSELPYRRIDGGLALTVPAGLPKGHPFTFTLSTHLTPAGWSDLREEKPVSVSLPAAKIPGAEKTSGYIAVDFPGSVRVTPTLANGLESRDPRTLAAAGLPLSGRLAWFRLDDFALTLKAERKSSEFHAAVALQVLPLLNSLETEGQISLRIAQAPLRRLTVTFPQDVAAAVRWDSPLITEKSLAPDGSWTLRFQQELEGEPALRFHLSTPLADPAAATVETTQPEGRRFRGTVSLPSLPAAKRTEATIGIEANTDTELTFPADPRLDPLDSSKLPALSGYTPRHRVVGACSWLGSPGQPAPALRIDGVRHKPGSLVTTVADSLTVDSVLSPDGPVRHQASLLVRTSADQFLDLTLPPDGRLLTLIVASQPAKPLEVPAAGTEEKKPASGRRVRIQLPRQDGSSIPLSVIYETPGVPLDRLAAVRLVPLTLPASMPVLSSRWRLHLPDGFSYSAFDSNLQAAAPSEPVPSLATVLGTALQRNTQDALAAVDRALMSGVTAGSSRVAQRSPSGDPAGYAAAVRTAPEPPMTAMPTEAPAEPKLAGLQTKLQKGRSGGEQLEKSQMQSGDDAPQIVDASKTVNESAAPDALPPPPGNPQADQQRENARQTKVADGAADLGDYDFAREKFQQVLQGDPSNAEALRGLKQLDNSVAEFRATSRDRTRARMAGAVDELFETATPSLPARPAGGVVALNGAFAGSATSSGAIPQGDRAQGAYGFAGGMRFGDNAISPGAVDDLILPEGAARGFSAMRTQSGLLPLDFDLPDAGRSVEFAGPFAPGQISFRVQSWERQMRQAWWLMVAGGLAFVLLARQKLWLLGLGIPVALHFLPILAEQPDWLPSVNALNLGWLAALTLTLGYRLTARAARRIEATEPHTTQPGKEAAHA